MTHVPEANSGTANKNLHALLDKVCGKGLCVSLLFDPTTRYWDATHLLSSSSPELPAKQKLLNISKKTCNLQMKNQRT